MFYKDLDMYRLSVQNIEPHAWWSVLRMRPYLNKYVASVMAVLMGGQPSGLQCNLSKSACRICNTYEIENVTHILLRCPEN